MMPPLVRSVAVALASIALHAGVGSQPRYAGMPLVHNYPAKEYGGDLQSWSMVRDHRGLLYVGTGGVSIHQFDGAVWRRIAIPSDVTRCLTVDSDGRIWVGLRGDFGYLEPDARGTLKYVSLLEKVPADQRTFSDVWQIVNTRGATYFRAFEQLFRWDGAHMHVWTSPNRFQALSEVRGHIFTAQTGIGIEEIVGDELRPSPGGAALSQSTKLLLYPWDNNRILISARAEGVYLYDGQTVSPLHTAVDDYLKENQIYTSSLLADGGICVNTLRGGSVILEHDGSLRRIIAPDSGLLSEAVYTSYQDDEGALWLGLGPGIARVELNSPISIFSQREFSSIAFFGGSMYGGAATGGGALFQFVADPRTGSVVVKPLKSAVTQAFKLMVFHDPSPGGHDQLLAATGGGIMRVEGEQVLPVLPAALGANDSAYDVYQSRKFPDRIYIGRNSSVSSIRWQGGKWIDEGIVTNAPYGTQSIMEDPDGTVWAGTLDAGTVLRFESPSSGLSKSKMEVLTQKDGLPPGSFNVSLVAGQLFAVPQTAPGMYRWDAAAHRFVRDDRFWLKVDDARPSSLLWQHPNGDVWSTTFANGIERLGVFHRTLDGGFQLDENSIRQLSTFSVANFQEGEAGGTVIAANEGVVAFSAQAKGESRLPFSALVRSVRPSSGDILFGGDAGAVPGQVSYEHNSLRFVFGAPVFGNESETLYQYFLEGADKEWNEWDKQHEANYSGLGPGDYKFRVRARSFDGRTSEEGDYSFTVLPPWYRTNLAYALFGFALLFAIVGGRRGLVLHEREKARRQREALEAQAKALEETVAERTREIREQAQEIATQKDRIQHAYETVELLSDIGREITASLDLDTILFKLYERVNQLLDAGIFGVGLYRPDKHVIEYTLAIENGKRYTPYTRDTKDKNQFAVWCIDHRKPVLLNDVENEYSKYIAEYKHVGWTLEDGTVARPPASMIYLPLVAQDRVLGVISVQSFRRNAYTEHHIGLLENLASYTTIALDNAGAYRLVNEREMEVRERAAELATINRITHALSAKLDMNSVIQLVGDQVRDLFHAPMAYVALLDSSAKMVNFPYVHGDDLTPVPFGQGLTSQIIRTGQALLINHDMESERSRLGVKRLGNPAASYLGVPIPAGGEIIGVISVQTTSEENRFNEADQRLLSTIASAVGVAMHNARLFEETRQARAAAEEADAAKSSFLSTVSHELRTPLTSVLGFAKIIRRRLEERLLPLIPGGDRKVDQAKQQVLDNLTVVVSEGERLTKLIDDVLDLAKIEAGKFTWNMETLAVSELIDRAVTATSSLFEGKPIQLVQNVELDLPVITGDRDRLIQVVINLISNAVKFTPAGAVTVAANARGGEITVSVTDSGIGIAPSDHQKVFEKFKQVGDTLTDKPHGTGLGLPICKEIVEHHGGRIWVESALGHGSTFAFSIPAREATRLPERPMTLESLVRQLRERVASHQPAGKSILIVDDDPNIRSLLQQEFLEAGYHVRLAADGREALQRIREQRPGLVVLDVMMPEMNGFDVAAVLKNDPVTMDIPIIILSIVEDKERGYRIGVDRYLTKPIDTSTLFREVGQLLDQGKSHKKVMIVDEDESTVRTLTQVLEEGGYQVVESDGRELMDRAVSSRPDIIILNSVLSGRQEAVHSLRFEKGLENVLFLIYDK